MRKLLMTLIGILMLGIGAALLRYANLGSDPFNTMLFAISGYFSISFTATFILISAALLVLLLVVQRSLLGVASLVILFGLGPVVECTLALLSGLPQTLPFRVVMMVLGLLTIGVGCAFCLQTNMGVAPYDGMAPVLEKRLSLPFFLCRIITDSLCVAIGMLLGGRPGIGTLLVAFCLGPVIDFFLRHLARPLLPSAVPVPSR